MFRRIRLQLPIAWAVLFAVLFNIALPTLASVHAKSGSSPILAEVCTSTGTKKIVVSGATPPVVDQANLLHDGHCQLCPSGVAASPAPAISIALPITVQLPHQWAPPPSAPDSQRDGCALPPSHAPPVFS